MSWTKQFADHVQVITCECVPYISLPHPPSQINCVVHIVWMLVALEWCTLCMLNSTSITAGDHGCRFAFCPSPNPYAVHSNDVTHSDMHGSAKPATSRVKGASNWYRPGWKVPGSIPTWLGNCMHGRMASWVHPHINLSISFHGAAVSGLWSEVG